MYKPINQMRLLRFLPLGLLILMSCSKEDKLVSENQGMGEITISLSSSDSSDDVTPLSKSVEENVPDVNDFEVEIYNSRGIRLYRDSYANSAGKKIPLNSGEYRLLAQHGDSAGVGFNADKAWFSADQTFTVHPQTSESISAVARMNKVKVAVKLGSNLLASYSDLYTLVRHAESSKELKFVKDETRAGYTLAGKLELENQISLSKAQNEYISQNIEDLLKILTGSTELLADNVNLIIKELRKLEELIKEANRPSVTKTLSMTNDITSILSTIVEKTPIAVKLGIDLIKNLTSTI